MQLVATELFKVANGLFLQLGCDYFKLSQRIAYSHSAFTAFKIALKSGSHMLFHVGFVESTSIRLVSFNI